MYYKPPKNLFVTEEFFPAELIQRELNAGRSVNEIWRLMDWRIVWTQVEIRKYFGKPCVLNDYKWGGRNQYRGFRPFVDMVRDDHYITERIVPEFSSFTSQHCFGRATDSKTIGITAEEIRDDIKNNPMAERYKYITAVELNTSWLHIDCRPWNKEAFGIFYFGKGVIN